MRIPATGSQAIIRQVNLKVIGYVLFSKTSQGSPYAQELISHLQPYCTPRKTERGEQLDFKVNGQGMCYLILEEP